MQLNSSFVATRRFRILFPLSILVTFGIAFSYYHTYNSLPGLPELKYPSILWSSKSAKFWPSFAPLLAAAAPSCSAPEPPLQKAVAKNRFYDALWNIRKERSWLVTVKPFPNLLSMNESDIQSMQQSHSLFLDLLKTKRPEIEYERGTKGIVTSAGGSLLPVLIISLLMLRRSGSTLPVEVFLAAEEEYESQICDVVLPSLNARCIILSDLLQNTPHTFTIKTYQLKIFAMLFSSFESLLFLDADNFPIHPPEELFDTEPFTTHQLVLWPDYWTSTASPYFSTITGLEPSVLQTRPTIEAGQILVSKRHHAKTLLLAAYYNVYSNYFYTMLTQGGPGEGDKDTFASAALVLNTTFYTVDHPPVNLGVRSAGGSATVQYDPSIPFNCPEVHSEPCKERPFFIHASWPPKMNALSKILYTREWGSESHSMELFGFDLEKVVWGYMIEVACNDWEFMDWGKGNKSQTGVCEQSRKCFRDVFGVDYEGENDVGIGGDGGLT